MNNSNQNPQNPQMKMGLDPSKMPIQFNPSNMASLTGGHRLLNLTDLTSAFGGGGGAGSEGYGHFLPGEVTHGELVKRLREKFGELKEEVEKMEKNPDKFKAHQLPLARIKKIMKSDEDVRMISAEAPVLFAKACELFIVELTHRAWVHTEEGKRRTLQKTDVAQCIANTDIFDFLIDIIPREEYAKTAIIKKSSMLNAFSNQMGYGVPGSMPAGAPNGMPGGMPGAMPNGMPSGGMPGGMPGAMPGGMPNGMPAGMPGMPNGMQGGMPPGMSGLGFNPQMMQGNNMANPTGQQNSNANKNLNPAAYMQQNMMFMQNLGMMGGPMDKNMQNQKDNQ